ncbi:MAG: HepT-like ribonuclease domain-containing protein [Pelotomaculum sp.]
MKPPRITRIYSLYLGNHGVLPKNFAKELTDMARFRNRLVHIIGKSIPVEFIQ